MFPLSQLPFYPTVEYLFDSFEEKVIDCTLTQANRIIVQAIIL